MGPCLAWATGRCGPARNRTDDDAEDTPHSSWCRSLRLGLLGAGRTFRSNGNTRRAARKPGVPGLDGRLLRAHLPALAKRRQRKKGPADDAGLFYLGAPVFCLGTPILMDCASCHPATRQAALPGMHIAVSRVRSAWPRRSGSGAPPLLRPEPRWMSDPVEVTRRTPRILNS